MNEELKEVVKNLNRSQIGLCAHPENCKSNPKYQLLKDWIEAATTFLPTDSKMADRIYYILNDLTTIKLCSCGCGTPIKDLKKNFTRGHGNGLQEIKDKKKAACLEKYGVEFNFQAKEIKDKIKATMVEKFGVENCSQSEAIKIKKKETTFEHYGVETPAQSDIVKKKMVETNIERYGVSYGLQSEEVKQKGKQTNLENYGVENCAQREDVKEQIKQTNIERYGVENAAQCEVVKNKIKDTNLEKYGVTCVFKDSNIINRIQLEKTKNFYKNLMNGSRLKYELTPMFDFNNYTTITNKYRFKCNKCANEFESDLNNGKIPRCLVCYPYLKGHSQAEINLANFVKTFYNDSVIVNSRQILDNSMELDIYLPERKLAIEVNGIYWHSELNGKDRNYHLNKTLECESKGIRLIHVFEDELMYKSNIVNNRLKHIIGCTNYKIGARKCEVKEIEALESNTFLDKYHIQGKDNAGIRLGLFYKNRLVAVMTFCKNRVALGREHVDGEFELSRFATIAHFNIMGAGDKLLKYFEINFKPSKVLSYADRRWSNGNLYFKLGFKLDHISQPNYWYVKNGQREHRFNYRKDQLLKEGFDASLTEWQIMQEKGYDRIWDCGNYVFVKEY